MSRSFCKHGIVKTDCGDCTTEALRRRCEPSGSSLTDTERRLIAAENILSDLASGYWQHALNNADDGKPRMGDRVQGYWQMTNAMND